MDIPNMLKENIKDYINDKVDLVKLKTADRAGSAVSGVVVGLILARLFLFTMIFLSLSAAYAISQSTGKDYLGFLIVAGFYILLTVLVLLFREKFITMPIINSLLKKFKYKE
jgi:hypothetical protein